MSVLMLGHYDALDLKARLRCAHCDSRMDCCDCRDDREPRYPLQSTRTCFVLLRRGDDRSGADFEILDQTRECSFFRQPYCCSLRLCLLVRGRAAFLGRMPLRGMVSIHSKLLAAGQG